MIKHFLNLTNGLEWFNEVENPSLIRIESTAIEHKDWLRVLRDLDANFLMCVARGYQCHIYDCGTRREISKTISFGVPFLKSQLKEYWEGKPKLLTKESQELGRKLSYFRKYYCGNIDIIGHSRRTEHDGDVEFYKNILRTMT